MAVRSIAITELAFSKAAVWTGLTQATLDSGEPFEGNEYGDRSIQISGTFGAGGSINVEGSNNGTVWAILADPQGNALTFTTAKIEQVLEAVRYIRPIVTAGDGTTSLTATLFARRSGR